MFLRRYLLLALLSLAVATVSSGAPADRISMRSEGASGIAERWPAGQPVRLCALLVEFQEDDVAGTTGNGRMGSGFDSTLVIDPLPHDRDYFTDHLSFLRHYYETISRGNLLFDTTMMDVFPRTDGVFYQLDHPMWHYNYNTDDETLNRKLVELFVESCAKADSAEPELDFSQYDAILVFHAGVGKDFNIGYDPTPFDIPSAYISERDIQSYAGTVPSGVTRGIILPEGENQREVLDYGVELSLNGIMVKLFGNWLGLPDLFNTKTGLSGIGRWGMMDQGSGNMSALVPALPDAWSRVFMNWEVPQIRVPSGQGDTIRLARFGYESATQIVKIPVTPREYYLLENRDADADSIGYVTLWDRAGRQMRVQADHGLQVQEGFRVAVRASHYDFGIPGSGILIWHIDEDVIEVGLEQNTVNTNPDHRGVDLVEADGAQDIGREYGFASAGSGTELGIQQDAWYLNNSHHRAANGNAITEQFTDRTFPSARLYDGSYTRLRLSDFSRMDSVMSFVCRMEGVANGFPVCIPNAVEWAVADLDGDSLREVYVCRTDSLLQISHEGEMSAIAALPEGIRLASPSAVDLDGDGDDEVLFEGTHVGILSRSDSQIGFNSSSLAYLTGTRVFAARPESERSRILCVGHDAVDYSARLYDVDMNLLGDQVLPFMARERVFVSNLESFPARKFLFSAEGLAICFAVADSSLLRMWSISDSRLTGEAVVVIQPDTTAIFFDGYGYVEAETGQPLCLIPECDAPAVDWDGNGVPDGGGWWGKNSIQAEDAPRIVTPVSWIVDLDASGQPDVVGFDVVAASEESGTRFTRIVAASHGGGAFSGFPIAVHGIDGANSPFEWSNDHDLYVMSLTTVGDTTCFSPLKLYDAWRGNRLNYTEPASIITIGPRRLAIHNRADWLYCWPNPASDVCRFRITVGYAAQASVRVFDLAGRLVAELQGSSEIPEPFEVSWNLGNVESGVYLGRVKVNGSGQSLESQVKIAVVK